MLHPVHSTSDGYFNAFSRQKISLYRPDQEAIRLEDIAHALSNICRFGGHTKRFYSVAQHSCLVSYLAPAQLRFAALMHDAAEAYLGDVIKPLKHILNSIDGPCYRVLEERFEHAIAKRFGIDAGLFKQVKPYDMQAVEIEHGYFFLDNNHPFERIFNSEEPCWTPSVAKEVFLSTFRELKT